MKWIDVCVSKSEVGLGIRDPQHSNATMGAQIWWQWLSKTHTPWARLWVAKYANDRPPADLIRLSSDIFGSLIWNSAKQHSAFIQAHSFWEINSGKSARLWEDS